MSDQNSPLDPFDKMMEEEKDLLLRKAELAKMELALKEARVNLQMQKHLQAEDEIARAKGISYTVPTVEYLEKLQRENDEYMEAAKNSMLFICESKDKNRPSFEKAVPYFRKNLIFIGAKTGEGKSTAVANIILGTIRSTSIVTGRPGRVLVLTNEEKAEDVYNRVTCLIKGWAYTNHDKFTDEQRAVMKDYMAKLMGLGLMVVDDNFGGVPGNTTTIEGIKGIFENLNLDPIKYDSILIDYYQNVAYSKLDPKKLNYQVQEDFSNFMDQQKNCYPAPITVVGQCYPPDQKETPFEMRVKGSKSISVRATVTLEMIADRKMRRTAWVCHKSRFTESLGQSFYTGYDKGRFVDYTPEFATRALAFKEKAEEKSWNKKSAEQLAEMEKKNGKEDLEKAGEKGLEVPKKEEKA